MALELIRRLIKGSAITAEEHDANLDAIAAAIAGKAAVGDAGVAVAAHEAAANPHPGYLTAAEGDAAYDALGAATAAQGAAEATAGAALTAHEGAANPHPGYLTAAEGDAAYAAINDTRIVSSMLVVGHGADAATARPAGAPAVYWIGTVEPDNAIDGDLGSGWTPA